LGIGGHWTRSLCDGQGIKHWQNDKLSAKESPACPDGPFYTRDLPPVEIPGGCAVFFFRAPSAAGIYPKSRDSGKFQAPFVPECLVFTDGDLAKILIFENQ
jgi:hypothetical protein